MLRQQGLACHQRLDGQAAALQSLQHRVVRSKQALIAQTHHQQIDIRTATGRTPCPAAEQPEALGPVQLHQVLQGRQQLCTQRQGQVGGLEGAPDMLRLSRQRHAPG